MPAVNPGISVSRVGGSAQIKAMKKVAGSLKLLYSQYRELEAFAQFGSDLDADTKRRLAQGARIVEVLKQDKSSPVPVEYQVAILFAAVHELLGDIPLDMLRAYEKGLYLYLDVHATDVLYRIRTTGALSDEDAEGLRAAIEAYNVAFLSGEMETV